ncbi:MAG: DUF2339 domain-containing protein [Acidobacteriota bacterium]
MEEVWVFFGCSLMLVLPVLLCWILYRLHVRTRDAGRWMSDTQSWLEQIDRRLGALERSLLESSAPEAAAVEGVPAAEAPPPVEGPPLAEAPKTVASPAVDPRPAGPPAEVVEPPPLPLGASGKRKPTPGEAEGPIPEAETPSPELLPAAAPPVEAPPSEQPDLAPPSIAPPSIAPPKVERPAPEPRRVGWEEKIWTRLPVWLGAAAFALAAAFLVKISFERGWIGPQIRVALGTLLGIGLLGAGEGLRRSSEYVARGLSAAGLASLYVSIFAAVDLYGLIPAWLGFGLMALTTATAVGLALRQGYIIAVVGLVGGFLTPALVSPGTNSPAILFTYLLLLQVGLVAVTRRRHWGSLGGLSAAAGLLWVISFLGTSVNSGDALWLGLFLVASSATFVVSALSGGKDGGWGNSRSSTSIAVAATAGTLLVSVALVRAGAFGTTTWIFFGLMAAGSLVLARLEERYHPLSWVAFGLVTFTLGLWLGDLPAGATARYLWIHVAMGALFSAAGYLAHRGSRYGGRWGSLASAAAVIYLLVPWLAEETLGLEGAPWGSIALALAVVWTVLAIPVARLRHQDEAAVRPLAALAVGATALAALAAPMELERAWLTVAWALEAVVLVWLAGRLRLGALVTCAWIASTVVGIRLVLNPAVFTYPIGEGIVFNWLAYGYGLPFLAFLAAIVLLERQRNLDGPDAAAGATEEGWSAGWITPGQLSGWLQLWVQGLAVVGLGLLIRNYFFPGQLDTPKTTLTEWGAYLVGWLLLLAVGLEASRRWPSPALVWGPRCLLVGVVGALGLMPLLALNPLWSEQAVGETFLLNRLLFVYGLPAALLVLSAKLLRRRGDDVLAAVSEVSALVATFAWVTFEVRRTFQGTFLHQGQVSNAESYAYSITWILLGILLAVGGVLRRRGLLRWGSLAVLLPAVGKVFLVDTGHLDGLYRVASLFGLGVSLFLIAFLYQRFVFRGPAADPTEIDR